jgi:aromatic-L-amino-acid decarboxylase
MNEHDSNEPASLDPADWDEFRRLGHQMLDDMVDFLIATRERPAWRAIPTEIKDRLESPMATAPSDLAAIYREFREQVLPYGTGNLHPAFFGWVHGGGTPGGMLAEMLAAGLNANLAGREHAPIYVERQVIDWARRLFEFPEAASGLLVGGTSMANLIAVLVARTARLGRDCRTDGLGATGAKLTAYASDAVHGCVDKAMDIAGLGTAALRKIALDSERRMDVAALRRAIAADIAAGLTPFLLVGTAGSVDTGAIDPLSELADIAREFALWFHIDGAFGALAKLSPALAPKVAGIERADSIAFDFHKWLQAPYDAACVLVRDGELHRQAFETAPAYLARAARGTGSGAPWFADLGPDLSRGFRALKVWFTLKEHGNDRLGGAIRHSCDLAARLAERIRAEPELELLAPVGLNIVCFRYLAPGLERAALDRFNEELVMDIQESGIAVPSTTRIDGAFAIRAALINHRTRGEDIEALVSATLTFGRQRAGK